MSSFIFGESGTNALTITGSGSVTTGNSSVYITGSNFMSAQQMQTPAGTQIDVKTTRAELMRDVHGVNPRLFFKLLKSKMRKLEKQKLEENLRKLQSIVLVSKDLGQQALYEKLMEMLAITVREMEVSAMGMDKFVMRKDIDKYKQVRKENGVDDIVFFERWENYPRIPPTAVVDRVKRIRDMALFDDYWVLYTDYTKGHKELKTNKEKIREKDPILFGVFAYQPDKFYWIADWTDEHCDLTLDKFIESLKKEDVQYEPGQVEFNFESFEQVKKDVMERHERYKNSNSRNFRDNMVVEDQKRKETPKQEPKPKTWGWFRGLFGKKVS